MNEIDDKVEKELLDALYKKINHNAFLLFLVN